MARMHPQVQSISNNPSASAMAMMMRNITTSSSGVDHNNTTLNEMQKTKSG